MRPRDLPVFLCLLMAPLPGLPALGVEGSLFIQAGPTAPREELGRSVPDWSGGFLVSTRISASGPSAEMALEALFAHEAAILSDVLYLEEAWAGWKPWDGLSLRLGRQRLGFGCGLAWSVVDDLDPQPMPFDTHAPRVGLDALTLAVDFAPRGAPIQVSTELFAPRAQAAAPLLLFHGTGAAPAAGPGASFPRIEDFGAAAQVSAFVGAVELGVAGSIKELSLSPPVAVGGWSTVDLAGFVLGAEGVWRNEAAELLLNCSVRRGDFAVMAEARWVTAEDRVWLFGELSWSKAELGAALAALFTVKEASGLVDLSLSYAASEALVLSAGATVHERPGDLPEIGPAPWQWGVTLGVEYFF